MIIRIPLALIVGGLVGSLITLLVVKGHRPDSSAYLEVGTAEGEIASDSAEIGAVASTHAEVPILNARDESAASLRNTSHGYGQMDMTDPSDRDLCISFWYSDMRVVVENLELHTGHKFDKKLGKLYASPVEVLEEQIAFMEGFLAETKRIAEKDKSDPSDQGKAQNP